MKILAVAGSPRDTDVSWTYRLVEKAAQSSGCEYELISLRDKKIFGCKACMECCQNNSCIIDDDMRELREKIVQADGYIIGAPNYFSGFNATTHAFLERWFQFRHQDFDVLWGKLAVVIGSGGIDGESPTDDIEKFLAYNLIETVAKVTCTGNAPCYKCKFVSTCKTGLPYHLYGAELQNTDVHMPTLTEDSDAMKDAASAGEHLGYRLKNDHDRISTAQEMRTFMATRFGN